MFDVLIKWDKHYYKVDQLLQNRSVNLPRYSKICPRKFLRRSVLLLQLQGRKNHNSVIDIFEPHVSLRKNTLEVFLVLETVFIKFLNNF